MKFSNVFHLKEGTLEELNAIITKPGFKGTISGLPSWMYHKCAGVSRSTLSDLDQSYAHFEENRRNPSPPSKDMIFGSAFHDYTLLPLEFQANFAVKPVKEEGTLETVEHIKAHLFKFIDTSKLKEELEGLEHTLKANEESCSIPCPADEELANLKPESFEDKKSFNAKQKELKEQIKEYQAACKNKSNSIKVEIKSVKEKISALESKLSGTKPKLIANLREFDKDVKIWDEIMDAFEAELAQKQMISQEEFSRIKIMNANCRNHPTIKALSQYEVIYEQTFFWPDPETGLLCKARPDLIFITPRMFLVADYKTTDDASPRGFKRTLTNFEYHIQSGYYLDGINTVLGLKLENFVFIPVEKQAPHQLALYALDAPSIETGRVKYKQHLKTLASFEPGGANYEGWKGYPVHIQDIAIPVYMMMEG